jgi:hypothetical protein
MVQPSLHITFHKTSPPNPELASLPDLFLLNPKHRAFVDGKKPFIDSQPWPYFMLALGIFFLLSAAYFWLPYPIVTQFGIATEATITERWTYYDNELGTRNTVAYHFIVEGQQYASQQLVETATYDALEEGSSVKVLYVPLDPNLSSLANGVKLPLLEIIVGFTMGVFFLLGSSRVIKRRLQDRRLSKGCLLRGEVTDWRTEQREDDEGGTYFIGYLRYRFYRPDGSLYKAGTSKILQANEIEHLIDHPAAGTPVAVLYLSDDLCEVL